MHVKITAVMRHPETGAEIGRGAVTVGALRDQVLEGIEDLISGRLDHYTDTPAERRAVLEIRVEYV